MKKLLLTIACLLMIVSFSCIPAFAAVGTGDIVVEYPTFTIGYLDQYWQFQTFASAPSLFNMSLDSLQAADKAVAVLGSALTGNLSTITKTDVTGKTIAVQNHAAAFKMMPGKVTSAWPSIWLKGSSANSESSDSKPANYLTGTDADKFYQMGLLIQAPYWDPATYQWSVYMFADKDMLTQTAGPATGKVLDPRVASMRWYSWADDTNGIPQKMWKEKDSAGNISAFNTLPLIASTASDAQKKAFLTGTSGPSLPETATGLLQPAGSASDPTAVNSVVYNIARNTPASNNGNGITIVDRSQAGLVYASPSDAFSSHRTEYLHVQFLVKWPSGIGIATGAKNCQIDIYQKTAD